MKYALIGCGRVSPNHFRAALENRLEIVAVCDLIPGNMEARLSEFGLADKGIRRYTDYLELLKNEKDLDLVAIATDSGEHAKIALACIDRGINLIIEKPISMRMADADEIVRRSEEKGVTVCACHQNRFNTAVQKARAALEAGRFGKLSHGSIVVRWMRDKAYYDQAAWRGRFASDGGTLMNQCIHGIDLLRWMMGGEAVEVFGATRRQFHDYIEAEDVGVAVVKFKNGAVATIEGTVNTFGGDLEETLCLFGEEGLVKIAGTSVNEMDTWRFSEEHQGDGDARVLKEATVNVYGNGHISLYTDVIDAIKTHRPPYVTARAGRDALEMVLAIYKSQKTGLPVTLPLTDFGGEDMEGTF